MAPICKLCEQARELCDSHYLPTAVYAECRDASERNPNPVVMDGRVSVATSKQLSDYVLCGECEQRFNALGERWVLGNMWKRGSGFPLQEVVAAQKPIFANETYAQFSTIGVPQIDMGSLVYFGVSVFWRGSAHAWRSGSMLLDGISLGAYEEPVRRFLVGDVFPKDVVIIVQIWPTKEVLVAAHTPRRIGVSDGIPYHAYNFYIPGFEFMLAVGKGIPAELRELCSYASKEKFLFANIKSAYYTIRALHHLAMKGRETENLKRFREEVRRREA